MKDIYAVLVVKNDQINEDSRSNSTRGVVSTDSGPGIYVGSPDPRMYSAFNFGRMLQNQLNDMARGYSAKVADFGKYVTATVTYSNPISGTTREKTFVIVFEGRGGDGMVFSSSTRWRSISGVSQAASYIRSACGNLQH
jgi:hypothetical protein